MQKKSLGNKLYELKKLHPLLSEKVIKAIQKDYAYVLAQQKGNASGLAAALRSIQKHLFGEHSTCGSWCGHHGNPTGYRHKNLPYGKDLGGMLVRLHLKMSSTPSLPRHQNWLNMAHSR